MAINIQADSTLPQGYLRIDGTTAATFSATSLTVPGSVSAPNTFGFKNRLINGDMRIDQRNNGAATNASDYIVDRWTVFHGSGTIAKQRSTNAPTGFTNSLGITVTSAMTRNAADYCLITQQIEGFNVADFGFGTANAQPITLSFWANSSVAGTYACNVNSGQNNFYYAATYTLPASTWTRVTITIPAYTTGGTTEFGIGNGSGLMVRFDLGSGSNYTTAAGSWGSGNNKSGVSTSVNFAQTAGATFFITGVQLERGSIATPFDVRPYGTELQLCQRYFYANTNNVQYTPFAVGGYGIASGNYNSYMPLPVTMRSAPSISNVGTFIVDVGSPDSVTITGYRPSQQVVQIFGTGAARTSTSGQLSNNQNALSGFYCSAEL